jgi:hypothetical protein
MKDLRSTVHVLVITLMISSTAFGGNIAGMRTTSTGNIGGMRTASTGNIGGMRTSSAGNIGGMRTSSVGNIGELRSEEINDSNDWSNLIAGTIGGFVSIFLRGVTVY